MARVSKIMVDVVGRLVAMPPPLRNEWLVNECTGADRRHLFDAVAHELGTPFGLWRDDPVGFVTVALGDAIWSVQREVLTSVRERERTVVPSCHGAGKTWLAARVVLWWVMVWPPGSAKAPTTADRWWKVKGLLWDEISRVHERARLPGECLTTELKLGGRLVSWGLSPQDYDEDAFSGIHAPHLLIVVDEAGSLSPTLGRSLESVMSGGTGDSAADSFKARMLAIGNPPIDETASPWFEERTQSPHYSVVPIPTARTPNFTDETTALCTVHPNEPPHPISDHLPTPHSVQIIADEYGTTDPYYVARVLAQFPKDFGQKAIPRSWVDEAIANVEPDASTWVRLGIDVAADGGDEFVVALAAGHHLRIVHTSRGAANTNPHDVAGAALDQMREAEALAVQLGSDRQVRVKIDALGLGWGVVGILKAWGQEGLHHCEVIGVKVSEKCTSEKAQERFAAQRDEMWWNMRELCRPRSTVDAVEKVTPDQVEMPPHYLPPAVRLEVGDTEAKQLSAPTYGRTSSGKIKVESKDSLRKRGIKSPDRAEALLLAVYEPGYGAAGAIASAVGRQLPTARRRSGGFGS